MLEQLLAEGTKYVFGNPGTTEQAFIDALQDYPQIEYILALQEAVATGIADGYARACGRAAFLQLHIMPGLGNAMGMLYNSYRTGTPLVVYAGQHQQRGGVRRNLSWPATSSVSLRRSRSGRLRRKTRPKCQCCCVVRSRPRPSHRAGRSSSPFRRT
jgi:hypothetical protein